jgi:hypothetical protein
LSKKKAGNAILVMPAIATEIVESAGKNFVNSSDQGPAFKNTVSV